MKIQGAIEKADKAAEKAAAKEATKARKEHGVEQIEGNDKNWWDRQNISIIKQQAELRGHRFNDYETKGGTTTISGIKTKFKSSKKKTI